MGYFFSTKQGRGALAAQLAKLHVNTVYRSRGSVCSQERTACFSVSPITAPLYSTAERTPPGRSAWRAASSAGMLVPALLWTVWSAPGSHPKLNITPSAEPGWR